jgi:hypothetical protein
MNKELERRFNVAMYEIYRRAKSEAKYNATRFLHMLDNNGGLETAHILINASAVSDGYMALWERGRLDLTVEAIIMENPEYHILFSKNEMLMLQKRLIEYMYKPAMGK